MLSFRLSFCPLHSFFGLFVLLSVSLPLLLVSLLAPRMLTCLFSTSLLLLSYHLFSALSYFLSFDVCPWRAWVPLCSGFVVPAPSALPSTLLTFFLLLNFSAPSRLSADFLRSLRAGCVPALCGVVPGPLTGASSRLAARLVPFSLSCRPFRPALRPARPRVRRPPWFVVLGSSAVSFIARPRAYVPFVLGACPGRFRLLYFTLPVLLPLFSPCGYFSLDCRSRCHRPGLSTSASLLPPQPRRLLAVSSAHFSVVWALGCLVVSFGRPADLASPLPSLASLSVPCRFLSPRSGRLPLSFCEFFSLQRPGLLPRTCVSFSLLTVPLLRLLFSGLPPPPVPCRTFPLAFCFPSGPPCSFPCSVLPAGGLHLVLSSLPVLVAPSPSSRRTFSFFFLTCLPTRRVRHCCPWFPLFVLFSVSLLFSLPRLLSFPSRLLLRCRTELPPPASYRSLTRSATTRWAGLAWFLPPPPDPLCRRPTLPGTFPVLSRPPRGCCLVGGPLRVC